MPDQTPSDRSWDRWFSLRTFGLALGTLLFVMFFEVLLGYQTFFYRDYGVLAYPALHFQHESFWRGEFPLWNHLTNCGVPFAAQWGTMSFYPPTLFYLLFPLPWSANAFCLAHLFLAGMGMYCCAKNWSRSSLGGFVAGLGFIFNGFTMSCLIWPNYCVALGWMPWVVLLVHKAATTGKGRLAPAVLVSAMQMLSGVPETIALTWLIVGFLILISDSELPFPKTFGRLTLIGLFVAGICAIQLLPFFELLAQSQRSQHFDSGKWSVPSWGWINFLIPIFRSFETPEGIFFQPGQEFVTSYYLPLALLGFAGLAAARKDLRSILLLAASVLAVALAMGDHFIVYPALKRILPFLGVARFPVKFLVVATFLIPLTAACGVRYLMNSTSPRKALITNIVAVAVLMGVILSMVPSAGINITKNQVLQNGMVRIAMLGLGTFLVGCAFRATQSKSRILFTCLAIACIPLDFVLHTHWQNPTLPSDVLKSGFWQPTGSPKPQAGTDRVFILSSVDDSLNFSPIANTLTNFLGKRLAQFSSLNMIDSIPKVNGSATLQVGEEAVIQRTLYSNNVPPTALLDFLAVSHISNPESKIQYDRRSSPRTWVSAGAGVQVAPADEILKSLFATGFDPAATSYIDERTPSRETIQPSKVQISVTQFAANRMQIHAEAELPALLTLAESHYPEWKVFVDGREEKLLRVNYAFMGVTIPKGSHDVVFKYADKRMWMGAIITVLSLGLLAALAKLETSRLKKLI